MTTRLSHSPYSLAAATTCPKLSSVNDSAAQYACRARRVQYGSRVELSAGAMFVMVPYAWNENKCLVDLGPIAGLLTFARNA